MSFQLLDLCDRIRSAQHVFDAAPELPSIIPLKQAAWSALRTLLREDLSHYVGTLRNVFVLLDLPKDPVFASPDETEKEDPLLVWLWGNQEEQELLKQDALPDPLESRVLVSRILQKTEALATQLLRLQHARGLLSPEHVARVKGLPCGGS